MRRREFIRTSTLAFLGSSLYGNNVLAGSRSFPLGSFKSKNIIIIGAGLSGLVAGYELKKDGHKVKILEAKSRPGGRIRTIRNKFAGQLHAEAGASRIHHDHHLVHEWVKLFDLKLVPFYPEKFNDLFHINGQYVKLADLKQSDFDYYPKRYRDNMNDRMHHPVLKIEGGMDRLTTEIANQLKEEIYYGCPVIKLEQDELKARAYYEQAGKTNHLEGDQIICTIPFSVLKYVDVEPALSQPKSDAILSMSYYDSCRILFQTRRRFWEDDGLNGFGIYEKGEIWHPTFDQPGPRGILAYYPGQYNVRTLRNSERVSYALKTMKRFHPEINNYVEGSYSKFWDEDPYALGAVSIPELLGELRSVISEPEGRIHFAGEHISSHPRWMEGAIESGLRVAKEVHVLD